MPPKSTPRSTDAQQCDLCQSPLEVPGSRRVVVRRHAFTSVFRCTKCTVPAMRGGWHVDCVLKEFDPSDSEIGLVCPTCAGTVVAKRQPTLVWQLIWFCWAGYPSLPFFTPRVVEFVVNRALDFLVGVVGFMLMVLLHSMAPYHATYEPGIGQKIVYDDMPLQYERLSVQATDKDNSPLAVATMAAAWILGWNFFSVLINLFRLARSFCRWRRIQSARGITIE